MWKDIPTALRHGFDDCEGLASWFAAELRVKHKIPGAVVKLLPQPTRRRRMWHAVVVDLETGRKWDPSKRLGMRPRKRRRRKERR